MFTTLLITMYVNAEKCTAVGRVNTDNEKVYCDLFDEIEGITFNDWTELIEQAQALQGYLEDHPEDEWVSDRFYYTYTDENGIEYEDMVQVEIELA